jgi:hypothetical protein
VKSCLPSSSLTFLIALRMDRIRASSGVSILGGRPLFLLFGTSSVLGVSPDDTFVESSFLPPSTSLPLILRRVRGRVARAVSPALRADFSLYSSSSSSSMAPSSSSSSSSESESERDESSESREDAPSPPDFEEMGEDWGIGPRSGMEASSTTPFALSCSSSFASRP